ncbi:MAG TPA: sigma-70 family RNA polymerase sigma factor [Methylomirabilota bacterium]|nr:sigma-70 family RNA polymerase sigma factor [Methylomirabilota bacterium]
MRGPVSDPPGLVDRLRAGEPAAFEDLVRTYQHRVFGVAARMLGSAAEAEEIAQEVFLRVHRSVGDFRGQARLSTWLYAITSRLCLNRLASGARRRERADEEALREAPSGEADGAAALERGELETALRQAIAELPEERRIVVVLRDVEGLSYDEIAAALDLEPGTVRSRLHRARTDLKAKLERFLP